MHHPNASMEVSVSFVSWINEQLREQAEIPPRRRSMSPFDGFELSALEGFVVVGVAGISCALASLLSF
ncbi:MAG: hypothetical protein ACYTGL_22715 [Planctomycetota bacterium]|jgi:hypothetical protein